MFGLACSLAVQPSSAQAQGAVTLDRLEVQLWPEYDKPEVLVMLVGFISDDTPMPTTVGLKIPKGLSKPHAVAKRDPTRQGLLMADYTMDETDPAWVTVNVTTEFKEFRVEYYAALDRSTPSRKYRWAMPLIHDVKAATFQIQQPKGATDLKVVPAAGDSVTQEDGLTYYSGLLGSATAGQEMSLELSYTKVSMDTSAAAQPIPQQMPPAQPAPMGTMGAVAPSSPVQVLPLQAPVAPGSGSSSWLMYLLVGVLSAAAMWAFMTLRKPQSRR
jgi:hypothetical protein